MITKTSGLLCRILLALMVIGLFLIVPFYYTEGYAVIGEDKYRCFWVIIIPLLFAALPLVVINRGILIFKRRKKVLSISETDVLVFLYLLVNIIGYSFSPYRENLWLGEEGWYMGMRMQIILFLLYYLFSRFWNMGYFIGKIKGRWILWMVVGISCTIIYILGILNRFSIRPLKMDGAVPEYISTLGNNNWFCSFWSVTFPIGLYIFWSARNRLQKLLAGFFSIIGISAGLLQGSRSGFLSFLAVYALLFWISLPSYKRTQNFLELHCLFWGCIVGIGIVKKTFPNQYNFEDPLIDTILQNRGNLFLFGIAIFCWIGHRYFCKNQKNIQKIIEKWGKRIFVGVAGLGILGIVGFIWRGSHPNFLRFLDMEERWRLTDDWGSGRGFIWKTSLQMFVEFDLPQRLFGMGPDGYASFLYDTFSETSAVISRFGGNTLTNGHCEWLSILINQGLFGLVTFGGFCFTTMKRQFSFITKYPSRAIFLLAMISYLANNLVSFQEVLNIPYFYLWAGISESILRRYSDKTKESVE